MSSLIIIRECNIYYIYGIVTVEIFFDMSSLIIIREIFPGFCPTACSVSWVKSEAPPPVPVEPQVP